MDVCLRPKQTFFLRISYSFSSCAFFLGLYILGRFRTFSSPTLSPVSNPIQHESVFAFRLPDTRNNSPSFALTAPQLTIDVTT